jgi:hypothetical protein
MDLMSPAIDLLKQALQINRSARTSRGDYQFHNNNKKEGSICQQGEHRLR